MDYKKIIKNQKTRIAILNLLSWVPDKTMLKLQYRIKTGRKLNLKNPQRYTEKIQWYKLNYKNPLLVKCVDKYEVRDYVKEKGFENILNECYGVYNSPEEIDFDNLPNSFVLKDTLGGGGKDVIICEDKRNANIDEYKKIMNKWIKTKLKKSGGREWPYYCGKKHRIICERLIERGSNNDLIDYKFFCFNGIVDYIYVITDRKLGNGAKLGVYDKFFNKLNASRNDEIIQNEIVTKPKNYNKMIEYSEILSKDFPHARIDFYNIDGTIIFGEITFYDGSGYMTFTPDSFDYELGKNFKISMGDKNGK